MGLLTSGLQAASDLAPPGGAATKGTKEEQGQRGQRIQWGAQGG